MCHVHGGFPGMTVRMTSAGTECLRYTGNKHTPKTYSFDNNMHPGPISEVRSSPLLN